VRRRIAIVSGLILGSLIMPMPAMAATATVVEYPRLVEETERQGKDR
jgi:hypothetical protein